MTMVVWPHRASPFGLENAKQNDAASGARRDARTATQTFRVIMAGGGTGGHLYPGLAVAAALEKLADTEGVAVQLTWAATPRTVDQRLLGKFGTHYVQQPVQPLVKQLSKLWPFFKAWQTSCSFWRKSFGDNRPHCVVALGGYAAGPAAYIASKTGVPVVLLNPDAVPGLANRFLLKRSQSVFTQWPLSARDYQKVGGAKIQPLGCPIREDLVGRSREDGAASLGVDATRKTLVITGASLGAKTINDAMLELLKDADLRKQFEEAGGGWQIIHLTGLEQADAVRAAYAAFPAVRVKVIDYCDDMASVWAIADLAIARAGASTCAELTACGVPSILLPYPYHKDMHQRHNAAELVKAGAATIVDDRKDARLNASAIKTALQTLIYNNEARTQMAEAAAIAGKPHAATAIAQEIMNIMRGNRQVN